MSAREGQSQATGIAAGYLPPLVIGGGNMARAIVEGAGRAGLALFRGGVVVEPDLLKHAFFETTGMSCSASITAALEQPDPKNGVSLPRPVLLAGKPQMLGDVARDLAPLLPAQTLLISILAGTTIDRLRASFPGITRVVRVMPNLAASIGKGATAVTGSAGATESDLALVRGMFSAVGPLVVSLDESLMDAFTALAGSGPAYLYYLAEAMVEGGVAAGFDRAEATAIVRQTLGGAGSLLEASDVPPEALRAAVTSRGGTTAAATAVLDRQDVRRAVVDAIVAGRDRGRELGKL